MTARGADVANSGTLSGRLRAAGLDWIVPAWGAPASVHAFVTTRNGGVGTGSAASMDLGNADGAAAGADARHAVVENRRRVQAFLPAPPAWLDQVHGASVADVDRPPNDASAPALPRADAAVTRGRGVVLAVRIADCLPVLFSDRAGTVVGCAHAGWRGLAEGVLENAVLAMACDPARLVAWLGPSIGAAAFEVGDEVREAFVARDRAAADAFVAGRRGKWYADLEALARQRLARAGVTAVSGGGLCTASDPSRFFSYRREGTTGRMAAFVWMAGP